MIESYPFRIETNGQMKKLFNLELQYKIGGERCQGQKDHLIRTTPGSYAHTQHSSEWGGVPSRCTNGWLQKTKDQCPSSPTNKFFR